MKYGTPLIFSALLFSFASCGVHIQKPDSAREPVVVFKTKKDYRDHVSVQLSADGKTITASINRLIRKGELKNCRPLLE